MRWKAMLSVIPAPRAIEPEQYLHECLNAVKYDKTQPPFFFSNVIDALRFGNDQWCGFSRCWWKLGTQNYYYYFKLAWAYISMVPRFLSSSMEMEGIYSLTSFKTMDSCARSLELSTNRLQYFFNNKTFAALANRYVTILMPQIDSWLHRVSTVIAHQYAW